MFPVTMLVLKSPDFPLHFLNVHFNLYSFIWVTRRKCYVTIAIILTFITLGMTVFFVYPRQPVLSLCARTKAIYERDRTSMDVFLEVGKRTLTPSHVGIIIMPIFTVSYCDVVTLLLQSTFVTMSSRISTACSGHPEGCSSQ